MARRLLTAFALLLIGALYWQIAAQVTGTREPWDAPAYWTLWYPVCLAMSACAGIALKRDAWWAGLLLTFAQVPIMVLNNGVGALVIVGMLFLCALAIPAMALAQLAGWIADRLLPR